MLRAPAPAKINVALSVLGRREDGYHEIDTLMVPLSFGDVIEVASARTLELARFGSTAGQLPPMEQDLVWRAAQALILHTGSTEALGAKITVHKEIPLAAGLGGGSADAAVTLRLLNEHWRLGLSIGQLETLAAELGSDVPFFLHTGPARATGRGEIVEPLAGLPTFWVVLVTLPIPKQTGAVYESLHRSGNWPRPNIAAVLAAWRCGDWSELGQKIANSLAAPMYALHPELQQLHDTLLRAGATAVLMSGAGPTMFGIAPTAGEATAVAERLPASLRAAVHVAQALTIA